MKEEYKILLWHLDQWKKEIDLTDIYLNGEEIIDELKSFLELKDQRYKFRELKRKCELNAIFCSTANLQSFFEKARVFSAIIHKDWYGAASEAIGARAHRKVINKLGEVKTDNTRSWKFPDGYDDCYEQTVRKMQVRDLKKIQLDLGIKIKNDK